MKTNKMFFLEAVRIDSNLNDLVLPSLPWRFNNKILPHPSNEVDKKFNNINSGHISPVYDVIEIHKSLCRGQSIKLLF